MVSVIIPNYNHAQYLKQRIDSVLEQTYADFELIILDDCSIDGSVEIIEAYRGHKQISQLIFNETNSGSPFKQWQKGIELAKGEYIWIAESDDWCEPTLLQTLVNGMKENEHCTLAYVQSFVVNGTNDIDKVSVAAKLIQYVNGKQFVSVYMGGHNSIINASMAIFKRDCYFNISLEYSTFKFCGDWLFWIEIALQGDVFISGKALNYFRMHGGDVSGAMLATGRNFGEEVRVLKIIKKQQLVTEQQFKQNLLAAYIRYLFFGSKFALKVRSEIENEFFYHGATSYKKFLTKNGYPSLLKIKIRNRLLFI